MKTCDVAIAGAGPAGCVAAKLLAKKGHKVVVVDKRGREGIGHDWWDTIEAGICGMAGLDEPEPPERVAGFHFELVSPLGDTGAKADMTDKKYNVDRKLFGARLVEAAESAGAELFFESPVTGPLFHGGRIRGLSFRGKNNRQVELKAKLTIDASGARGALRSKVPEKFGFRRRFRAGDCVRTWREIRADTSGGSGRTILVIGKYHGVQWVSRDNEGYVDVIACVPNTPGAADPKEICAELVREEGGMGGEVLRGGSAALIPVRRAFDSFVAPGFMIAGDCASMANPLNGSGVSSGMEAAAYAAATADKALRGGDCGIAALWDYNTRYKRSRDARFAQLYVLQRALFAEPPENAHLFLSKQVLDPKMFWEVEHMLDPAENIALAPGFLRLAGNPRFLARMTFAYTLMRMVHRHYMNYPAVYSAPAFRKWRMKTQRLLNLVPEPALGG